MWHDKLLGFGASNLGTPMDTASYVILLCSYSPWLVDGHMVSMKPWNTAWPKRSKMTPKRAFFQWETRRPNSYTYTVPGFFLWWSDAHQCLPVGHVILGVSQNVMDFWWPSSPKVQLKIAHCSDHSIHTSPNLQWPRPSYHTFHRRPSGIKNPPRLSKILDNYLKNSLKPQNFSLKTIQKVP